MKKRRKLETHYLHIITTKKTIIEQVEWFALEIDRLLVNCIDIESTLSYIFFDINEYQGGRKEKYLYKVFSKTFLLKEYQNNDIIHVLNDKFYQELLYIMGLKEKSGKSSKTILFVSFWIWYDMYSLAIIWCLFLQ